MAYTLTPHRPGTYGHAPVNGKWFFIHRSSRMTRVDDLHTQPVPPDSGWEHVTLDQWTEFRKETAAMSPAKRNKLHRTLYP